MKTVRTRGVSVAVGDFSLSFCIEVIVHAVLRLGSHEQIALSATCSGFQNAPLSPPSASPVPL